MLIVLNRPLCVTQVSADGSTWYTVFDSAVSGEYAETAAGKTHSFTARSVRYVRDYVNGSTANSFNHWVEIQVWGRANVTYVGHYYEWRGSTRTQTKYYTLGGQRVALRSSNGTSTDGLVYLLGDHLGSTSLTLDPVDGDKLTELRYKAYGQTRYASGTTSTARRFTGQIEDDYINLYQMGDRWYNAELGRWISPDPIIPEPGNPQSLNRYSYVVNNPLRYTDPTGHLPEASVHGEPAYDEPPPPQVPPSPPDGDPATPFVVGWEWLTGQGPRRHEFRDGDPFLEMLKKHEHIEDVREVIVGKVLTYNYRSGAEPNDLQGLEGVPKYFRDYTVLLTFGQTGNLAVTFLGSYTLYYYVVSVDRDAGTAEILFHVSNASSLASATRPPVIGYMPFWQDHIAPVINGIVSGSGPASTVTQAFWWTETVSFK